MCKQGRGSRLLLHFAAAAQRPVLIGTWAGAAWAIQFYEKHGFKRVEPGDIGPLLRRYWKIRSGRSKRRWSWRMRSGARGEMRPARLNGQGTSVLIVATKRSASFKA
jgi:hypothetical protein